MPPAITIQKSVMTVLPPKEGFSPERVGAIGLLVHRLAQPTDWIVGQSLSDPPFSQTTYLPIVRSWLCLFSKNKAYANGVFNYIQRYRPRLVEIHNRPDLALYIAKKFPTISISLTLHNDPITMRGAKTVAQRQRLLQKVHVVTVSNWLKDQFLSGNISGTVTVLPNTIDLRSIPPYVSMREREKTILFVGRIVADKGADLFVTVCQKLLQRDPTWKIAMIGADRFQADSQDTAFITKLREQIGTQPIAMLGYLSHDDVLQKMAMASLVIIPSRWPEPFGMTALEAMACGTPVVASLRGALPWVVGDAACLVDPEHEEDFFTTVSSLIYNQDLQEALSQKALERAKQYDCVQASHALQAFRQQICPALDGSLLVDTDTLIKGRG